ncbi:MAG: energy transducer TonB, partial [Steroidobacteraceae bacterium]
DSQFMTRRGAVLVAIVALHVFIGWALATGLARRAIELVAPPIQTQIVEEVKKDVAPPPPPPPTFERPPVEVPPPDVTINVPVETTTAIRVVNTPVVHAPPPREVRRTAAGVGGRGFPNSDDYYPDASRRLEEQGVATVHSCVGPDGKLTAEPTIARSSGSNRLDGGAIRLAKAASGRYTPATEDGRPVAGCVSFNVKFQLR